MCLIDTEVFSNCLISEDGYKIRKSDILFPCWDVCYDDFSVKTMFGWFLLRYVLSGIHVLLMIFVYIRILVSKTISMTDYVRAFNSCHM